ncbi:MAG: type II 3-dehydroquinate dehydratase [Gammaproteobacteria bacterium]
MKILLLNGPNMNLLGMREPEYYGSMTLHELEEDMKKRADDMGHHLESYQSNSEAELINHIHDTALKNTADLIIFNPAAFTHTSLALRDALAAVGKPFIEVHVSNVYKREAYRHDSYFNDIAEGVITGFGIDGYFIALNAADYYFQRDLKKGQTQHEKTTA